MDKHAYCIMAHNNWAQLQMLIDCLDDKRNDIFLHIDKKSLTDFCSYGGVNSHNAGLFFCNNFDVVWGDISQTDAEIELYSCVLKQGIYHYVHLLSGSDLPLKNQDEIHEFFRDKKEDFLEVTDFKPAIKRVKYYHFFVRLRVKYPLFNLLRRILLVPQLLFVNRLRNSKIPYSMGANWCSLTYNTTKLLVHLYHEHRNVFKYTTNSDEHYKQMLLGNNPHVNISSTGNLRYVVFDTGNPSPHILRENDYESIISSECLFARKFDIRIDKNIVNTIINAAKENNFGA